MGALSKNISAVEPSQTLAIDSTAKALRAEGKDVIGFGAGEPDFDTPENVKEAACRAIAQGYTRYTPPAGDIKLREAVAAKCLRDNGLSYSPEQIVISCGAKHALYNAVMVLCNPGDEVVIISPYWVTYPAQVIMAGATPVYVGTGPENGYRLDAARLRKAVTPRTKAIILNSPSNPTGWVASDAELTEIAEIVLERQLYVVADEIYEKIIYPPAAHRSIASLGEDIKERTVVINGVSKSHAMTGWRIGWLAAPPDVAKLSSRLQSHCTSNPTSIAQAAAIEALNGDQGFTAMMTGRFLDRRDYLLRRLNAMPGVSCYVPQGTFYAFPEIAGTGIGSDAFASELLEKALVAVVPGRAFGRDSAIRLSFATSMDNIRNGMDRIERFLKERA
ncbi:MAG: pyridoxal phosphate-dependent aminotransferase [Candidatus Aureabacteria bacterium]|nr:pyridoxal phosphate-dependent aminotransferase [Candidatus Auribacterota bacterium]